MPRKRKELSIAEKVKMLYGDGAWTISGAPSYKLDPIHLSDGPCGLRIPVNPGDPLDFGGSKTAICYPAPCATASSWDKALMGKLGVSMGKECASQGINVLLSPGINIKRNPLCGRNFEYLSEDPLLSGKMAASFINGIQSQGVGACLKHFAANSQETYRMVNDSVVDQRALHEIYLRGFEIAIKESNPWCVMSSYNKINGVYASDSDELLLHTLKGKWGYEGVVMSDWGGCADPVLSHNHGMDVEMPCFENRQMRLLRAITSGKLKRAAVNDSAERIVLLAKRASALKQAPFDYASGHAVAVEAAEKSAVLLKNDGILPLKSLGNTAVIGEFARSPRIQGAGSSKVNPWRVENFLNCVRSLPSTETTLFSPGYCLHEAEANPESLILDAVDIASRCNNVILFLGLPEDIESEGYDRKNLLLPDEQIRLFDQIYSVNKNIVVVLTCGAPVELPFADRAKAVLLAYLPGEGAGRAILSLLTGKANPSGHLTETWPKRHYDVPSFGFYPGSQTTSYYRESIYVGYRYYLSANKEVAFPFGYGLSYSTFKLGQPSLTKKYLKVGEDTVIKVPVENTSKVKGEAVVQVYVKDPKNKVFKPERVLVGFAKVSVAPGETKVAVIELPYDCFCHYDVESESFLAEKGEYVLEVGQNCRDIEAKATLFVDSDAVFESKKAFCPVYYNPPVDGFIPYESDFEYLLGKPLSIERDPRSKPYTLNSTVLDISGTWVGKLILRQADKRIAKADESSKKMMRRSIEEMPLRSLSMGGMSSRVLSAVVDLANGNPLKALFHLIAGGGQ